MLKLAIALSFALAPAAAYAETTVIHRDDGPPAAVVVHSPAVVEHREVVHESDGDCHTKIVHKENSAGDSKTVKKTDCD